MFATARARSIAVLIAALVAISGIATEASSKGSRYEPGGRALEIVPNDALWPAQWSPVKTGAPDAWETTLGSPSITVAVLDSGVDFTHPDLNGRLVDGYDFINSDADPSDDNGHGTIVAGVVGAATNNGVGVASYCSSCAIMPVKVMDADGWAPWSAVSAGIIWATDHGASVINLSIGGTSGSSLLQDAIRYASERGVILVAGAGNTGDTAPFYPAAYEEVLAVAGSDPSDALYDWSTSGDWVDIAAPGANQTTERGGGYTVAVGTSTAAPVVAGIAGLALSASPSSSVAEVKAALLASASPVSGFGSLGRVDAYGTLDTLGVAAPVAEPVRTTSSFAGRLGPERTVRRFTLPIQAGATTSKLRFTHARRLRLTIVDSAGRVVASRAGSSVLTLRAQVDEGTYTWLVTGTRGRFRLAVVHPTL